MKLQHCLCRFLDAIADNVTEYLFGGDPCRAPLLALVHQHVAIVASDLVAVPVALVTLPFAMVCPLVIQWSV